MSNNDYDLELYEPLSLKEKLFVILPYWEEKNLEPIADLIRNNDEMSKGMRNFIADILIGKIKRPSGKRSSNFFRDIKIFCNYSVKL